MADTPLTDKEINERYRMALQSIIVATRANNESIQAKYDAQLIATRALEVK
jgi:hypothetical protein